jgi:acyl-CoA thioesterase-1
MLSFRWSPFCLTPRRPGMGRAASRSYGRPPARVQTYVWALLVLAACAITTGLARDAAAADRPLHLVALGDSLTAGYGLPALAAFPVRLQRALAAKGITVAISNAGVSGDTTADGLARLDWSVPEDTDAVILELGANDMLRGLDPKATRATLEEIVRRLQQRHIDVLLCGMLAAPNLGPDYARDFDAIFPELAAADNLLLYPFFLTGVATDKSLTQRDGLHPTAAGVDVIVAGILPKVEELITRVRAEHP